MHLTRYTAFGFITSLIVTSIFLIGTQQMYFRRQTTHVFDSDWYGRVLNRSLALVEKAWLRSKLNESANTSREDNSLNFRSRFRSLWDQLNPNVGIDSVLDSRKYMIYRCGPGMMGCGGWADRVKGMIIGYLFANLTGRVYKIDFRDPECDLTNALVPNRVDWRLPHPFHDFVQLENPPKDVVALDYLRRPKDLFGFDTLNVSHTFNQSAQYVYIKANLDHMEEIRRSIVYHDRLSWMQDLRKDQIFAEFYKRIFRLSPDFQRRMELFLNEHVPTSQHKLICAHIRMGQNPTIPQSYEQVRMKPEFLPVVWKFISDHSTSDLHKVFIMSDSYDTVAEASRQSFGSRIIETPGKILHIEYARKNGTDSRCEALEKVIFDQAVLMNCDVLLISKSGLSRMAAFVRGSDVGLYCLFPSGTISKCRSDQFTSLYHITG